MHRTRRKRFSLRFAALLEGWARRARFFWYRLNKTALIVLSVVGVVASLFSYMLYLMVTEAAEQRDLTCLARNVYYEARGEPESGQYAVAEVTMNRVASRYYPDTVCDVVYQKNWDPLRKRYVAAFSWTEFKTRPEPQAPEWQRAWRIAEDVYYERRPRTLDGALHYHADRIEPSWSREKTPVASIGKHRFYK